MLYCTQCGSSLSDDAIFCSKCGHKLADHVQAEEKPVEPVAVDKNPAEVVVKDGKEATPPINPTKQYCRNCGTANKRNAYGCTNCGLPLLKGNSFCPECGAGSNPDAVLCVKCGTVFPNSPGTYAGAELPAKNNSGQTPIFINNAAGMREEGSTGALIGSVLIIIGFFTNWISKNETSGFTLLSRAKQLIGTGSDSDFDYVLYVILAGGIILSTGICLLYSIRLGISNGAFSFFKNIPIIFIIILFYFIVNPQKDTGENFVTAMFRIPGIGLYLTLIGAVILCASKSRPSNVV